MKTAAEILAGRRSREPKRDSVAYPRLLNTLSNWSSSRPLIKPTPANIRMFARTTFCRRAINRIKDPIAHLGWEIVPKTGIKLNSTLQAQIDVVKNCLEQPNNDDSFRSFLEKIVEDILVNGAGVYEHQLGGDASRPLWCWPVDSMSIQLNGKWDGNDRTPRYYQTKGFGNIGGVQGTPLLNSEIVYIIKNPSTETPFGLGPTEVAFKAINSKLGVADYASKVASNAQPSNLLVMPGIDADSLLTMREYWKNDIEGQGQLPMIGTPPDSTTELIKLRETNDKSVFIAYQELLIREIATSFDLFPLSLGVTNDVNRSTGETIDDADHDNAVRPTASLVAAYITRETINQLLGFSQLTFQWIGLKRDDKEMEAKIYTMEYMANAITPNEYRERNGAAPLDNEFADMLSADVEIAKDAARSAAVVDDPNLSKPNPAPKVKPKAQGSKSS